MARLDSICSLNMGQSPDSTSYNESGDGLPFFQGNADFGELNPTVRIWCSSPTKIAENGDILISVRAPIGALNIASSRCCIGRGLAALTVNENVCNRRYLWYAISSKVDELNAKGTGSTFKAISKNVLAETDILLPKLCKQVKIVQTFDNVTNLISLRKQQLVKLDELVKARFVEMFGDIETNRMGWKKEPLRSHINMITGYPFDSSAYVEKGIRICGGLIILPDRIKWDECKYWSSIDGYEQFLLANNDIVVALDRPWITDGSKLGTITEADLPALLIQRTARIRGIDMVQSFVLYLLKSKSFERHCTVTGSLVPHISNKDINSYQVIVPPIELQNKFATFATQVGKSKSEIQKSLEKLETLQKALMQKYFG